MAILMLVLSAVIVLIDQVLKMVVVNNLKPNGSFVAINGLLDFVYVENTGAAFGILSEQRWLFITITLAIIFILIYILFSKKVKNRMFNISAALIIGGGIGNLIDRISLGYVVDYIQLSFFPAVCNFADYCVSAGTVLLLVWILFYYGKDNKRLSSKIND